MYAMADLYMYLSSYNCMCEKSQFNSLVLSLLMLVPIRSIWIIIRTQITNLSGYKNVMKLVTLPPPLQVYVYTCTRRLPFLFFKQFG